MSRIVLDSMITQEIKLIQKAIGRVFHSPWKTDLRG